MKRAREKNTHKCEKYLLCGKVLPMCASALSLIEDIRFSLCSITEST